MRNFKKVMLSIITLPFALGWVAIMKLQQLAENSFPEFANSGTVEVVGGLLITGLIYLLIGKLIFKIVKSACS